MASVSSSRTSASAMRRVSPMRTKRSHKSTAGLQCPFRSGSSRSWSALAFSRAASRSCRMTLDRASTMERRVASKSGAPSNRSMTAWRIIRTTTKGSGHARDTSAIGGCFRSHGGGNGVNRPSMFVAEPVAAFTPAAKASLSAAISAVRRASSKTSAFGLPLDDRAGMRMLADVLSVIDVDSSKFVEDAAVCSCPVGDAADVGEAASFPAVGLFATLHFSTMLGCVKIVVAWWIDVNAVKRDAFLSYAAPRREEPYAAMSFSRPAVKPTVKSGAASYFRRSTGMNMSFQTPVAFFVQLLYRRLTRWTCAVPSSPGLARISSRTSCLAVRRTISVSSASLSIFSRGSFFLSVLFLDVHTRS
mmetsp:Transcript_53526/g.164599  ORF Transcript_53526/g.164599 Transcript_53526/m.164599 type:complete len:360 (-) Transcript_53526:1367-2446(-)